MQLTKQLVLLFFTMLSTTALADVSGKDAFQKHCFACHNPQTELENRIAPPVFAIQRHYKNTTSSKNDFISAVVSYVVNPEKSASKMPGAIRHFGIMPKVATKPSMDELSAIAAYLYDYDEEMPKWYKDHHARHHGSGNHMRRGKGHGRHHKGRMH